MAEIIDGRFVSAEIKAKIKLEVEDFKQKYNITPALAVIVLGDNPASAVYVRNKRRACVESGIESIQIAMSAETTEEELLSKIEELNRDSNVNGILVQLPLPKHISEERVINAISPMKDVDAFHPENVGRITIGKYSFLPCTPAGIMSLLDFYNISLDGKRAVVIGRSNIVGKPLALLLLERNATVTVCHSHTENLPEIVREADIVVVAIGKAGFLKADMVKPGAVVIDVGINRLADGTLMGDVDFEAVSKVASFITPVPGGVGPMTIATLLRNTLSAARAQLDNSLKK